MPLHHFEIDLASQWEFGEDMALGTLPHVEGNYGTALDSFISFFR